MNFRQDCQVSDIQKWAQALQIEPKDLKIWEAGAPEGTPVIFWAIENGHISAERYLNWAREQYGMPTLANNFFESDLLTPQIVKTSVPAAPWCMPVAQWEDVIYVACIEPQAPSHDEKIAFVLADPACLRKAWDKIQGAPAAVIEAPAGINLNAKKFTLNLGLPEEPTSLTNTMTPIDLVVTNVNKMPPPPPLHLDPLTSTTVDLIPNVPLPDVTSITKVANAEPLTAVMKVSSSWLQVHEALKQDGLSHVFFLVDAQNAKAIYFEGLKPNEALTKTGFSITSPSLLRIVNKTAKPYQGFVVDSPTHQELFKAMGYEGLPPCVTALPTLQNEKTFGILLVVGPADKQTRKWMDKIGSMVAGLSPKEFNQAA